VCIKAPLAIGGISLLFLKIDVFNKAFRPSAPHILADEYFNPKAISAENDHQFV
jgi:hypothetical protein